MALKIQDRAKYSMVYADDQLLNAQNYEELQYNTRKLIDEYELWGIKLNVKQTKYMPIKRHTKRFASRR